MDRREFISRVTGAAIIPALPPIPPTEPPEPVPAPSEPQQFGLVYNGFRFDFPSTQLHTQHDNRADAIQRAYSSRLTIDIRANAFALYANNPDMSPSELRHRLTEPRRALWYAHGTVLLDLPDGDNDGGPWPDSSAITVEQYPGHGILFTWNCRVVLKRTGFSPAAYYDPHTLA